MDFLLYYPLMPSWGVTFSYGKAGPSMVKNLSVDGSRVFGAVTSPDAGVASIILNHLQISS